MNSDVASDMFWSSTLFKKEVWPCCVKILGGGTLLQMEGRPDTELAKELDMRAGIDGWHFHSDGIRGIASRIQAGRIRDKRGVLWDSFTVRMNRDSGAKTEFEKRLSAIKSKSGWIYPAITIQAYAETEQGPVVSIGIAKTEDVIRFIEMGLHYIKPTSNATFAVCRWGAMRRVGIRVKKIIPSPLPSPKTQTQIQTHILETGVTNDVTSSLHRT